MSASTPNAVLANARLANTATSALRAYDPGHDLPALRQRFGAQLAELGSNENPLGPSPDGDCGDQGRACRSYALSRSEGGALKHALARHSGLASEHITLGNGSHELLMLIAQCFADANTSVVFSEYGFAVFPIATAAVGARADSRAGPAARRMQPCRCGHDLHAMADSNPRRHAHRLSGQSEQPNRNLVRR